MLYRFLSASVVLALLIIASIAEALNENTTIVLHARDGFAPCDDPQQQGICVERPPTLDLTGMQMPWVYVMLRNYDQIPGFQCAFDWPPAWNYLGGAWIVPRTSLSCVNHRPPACSWHTGSCFRLHAGWISINDWAHDLCCAE